jgi:hypothetical protein
MCKIHCSIEVAKLISCRLVNVQKYVKLHVRMFSLLQQLHLISARRIFPNPWSFIPQTATSPIQLPALPRSMTRASLIAWSTGIFISLAPLVSVAAYHWLWGKVSNSLYRPLYEHMPKPVGDDPKWNRNIEKLWSEDEDITNERSQTAASQHDATLRRLEGLPDEEDEEIVQPTLVSFDVEPSEMQASGNDYSAELRNMNSEQEHSEPVTFRVTFLTVLPPVFASELMSRVITNVILLPVEMVMVKIVAAGFTGGKIVFERPNSRLLGNLLAAHAVEFVVGSVIWAMFSGLASFMRLSGRAEEEALLEDQ